jgi:hypothetical protein
MIYQTKQERAEEARRIFSNASEFKEADHPRGEDGKFGKGGGASDRNDPAVVNLPLSKRGDIDKQIDKYKEKQAKEKKATDKEKSEKHQTELAAKRAEAKAYHEKYADKIIEKMKGKASASEVRQLMKTWISVDPDKMILVAKKIEKEESDQKSNSSPVKVYRARK